MNLYTRNLSITQPPWRCQDRDRGEILSQEDHHIATVPKSGKPGKPPVEQRLANIAVITAAPELLAALREAAYLLETMGVPLTPLYYDLMRRAAPYDEAVLPPEDRALVEQAKLYGETVSENQDSLPQVADPTDQATVQDVVPDVYPDTKRGS